MDFGDKLKARLESHAALLDRMAKKANARWDRACKAAARLPPSDAGPHLVRANMARQDQVG